MTIINCSTIQFTHRRVKRGGFVVLVVYDCAGNGRQLCVGHTNLAAIVHRSQWPTVAVHCRWMARRQRITNYKLKGYCLWLARLLAVKLSLWYFDIAIAKTDPQLIITVPMNLSPNIINAQKIRQRQTHLIAFCDENVFVSSTHCRTHSNDIPDNVHWLSWTCERYYWWRSN